jgi:lipopolysaccharide biosynthesis protein
MHTQLQFIQENNTHCRQTQQLAQLLHPKHLLRLAKRLVAACSSACLMIQMRSATQPTAATAAHAYSTALTDETTTYKRRQTQQVPRVPAKASEEACRGLQQRQPCMCHSSCCADIIQRDAPHHILQQQRYLVAYNKCYVFKCCEVSS